MIKIFPLPLKTHHKNPASPKITLQVNKYKTKFDALLFKFLETLKTNALKFIIAEAAAFYIHC